MVGRGIETVVVTGASSGIGRVTCLHLAERGYVVVGTSRELGRLGGLFDDANKRGLRVWGVELDVNLDESVGEVMPGLIEQFGGVDALVNNAGFGVWGPVESLSMDELKMQFEANFFGAARMIQAVLPGMVSRRAGRIVNISSVLGRIGTPFNGAYVASKYALEGLSESLRAEVEPFGVRVSLVEPGLFATDFQRNQVRAARAGTRRWLTRLMFGGMMSGMGGSRGWRLTLSRWRGLSSGLSGRGGRRSGIR